jgi:hypothetical protein
MEESDALLREEIMKVSNNRVALESSIQNLESDVARISKEAQVAASELKEAQDKLAIAGAQINNSFSSIIATKITEE